MELLHGVELLEFLNESQELDDPTLRFIFLQVGNAIHQLHKAGISHRDIKPENIMLTSDFEIKVIDLGYGLPLCGRTDTGFMKTRLGTPMYMAPEIHDKTVYYQGQDADLFALGVSIFVAKMIDYPWKKPELTDSDYRTMAGDHGVNADQFWEKYAEQGYDLKDDFKDLIESLLAYNPTTRPSMADILGHRWMRGPSITKDKFKKTCSAYLKTAMEEMNKENEKLGTDHAVEKIKTRRADDFYWPEVEESLVSRPKPEPEQTTREAFHNGRGRTKRFNITGKPIEITKLIYEVCKQIDGAEVRVSENKWKITTKFTEGQGEKGSEQCESWKMVMNINELVENESYQVSVDRKGGSFITFNGTYKKFMENLKETD